MIGYEVITWL